MVRAPRSTEASRSNVVLSMGIFRIALVAALALVFAAHRRARAQDLLRAGRGVEPRDPGRGRAWTPRSCRTRSTTDRRRPSYAIRVYRRRLPRRRGPAGRPEPPLALPELVDGEVGDVDDLRPRDDARPDVAGRPGRVARPRGGQGARRDHRPRPAHDDLGPQVERRSATTTSSRCRTACGTRSRSRSSSRRHLLRVRAERGLAARRDRRPLGGRGRDGLRRSAS